MSRPLSIDEIVSGVQGGQLDPRDVVRQSLDRIRQHDGGLRAWVEVYEAPAMETAERLVQRRHAGDGLGGLAGVPIGVKDIFDIDGRATRAASALRAEHVAQGNADVVTRLMAADAIVIGKTVTTELACFDPPPTANPWNPQRTPGGSSSGSAAALAAGMCAGALGSQTGGSISRPAAFCGVAGLKPSHAALPTSGVVPISYHLDHPGPMARTVNDLSALWHALSGEMPSGSWPPQLAVLDNPYWQLDEGQSQYEQALVRLGQPVAIQLEADLPAMREHHYTIMAAEAAAVHRDDFQRQPEAFGEKVAGLIRDGLETPGWRLADALTAQRRFRAQVVRQLAPFDAVITPSAPGPAPARDSTGDPRMNSLWSLAGVPTIALPCGWVDGLPVGLQLAAAYREGRLLTTAAWCERLLEFQLPSYPRENPQQQPGAPAP